MLPRVALLGYAGSIVIAAVLVLNLIWRMIRDSDGDWHCPFHPVLTAQHA